MTAHTQDTPVPQTYWEHAKVAIFKSFWLIWYGLAGVVHGLLPEIKGLQFYTSTNVLKTAAYMMLSGRHDKEILKIYGDDFMKLVEDRRNAK
jgi:hypothetical protein